MRVNFSTTVNDILGKEWVVQLCPTSRRMNFMVSVAVNNKVFKFHMRHYGKYNVPEDLAYITEQNFSLEIVPKYEQVRDEEVCVLARMLSDSFSYPPISCIPNVIKDKIKETLSDEQKAELADWFLDGCTYLRRYL